MIKYVLDNEFSTYFKNILKKIILYLSEYLLIIILEILQNLIYLLSIITSWMIYKISTHIPLLWMGPISSSRGTNVKNYSGIKISLSEWEYLFRNFYFNITPLIPQIDRILLH